MCVCGRVGGYRWVHADMWVCMCVCGGCVGVWVCGCVGVKVTKI